MTARIERLLTIADWEAMPHGDGNRYEIIEGELFVSCSPGLTHQIVASNLIVLIGSFLRTNPIGTVVTNPGLILSKFSGVIPDVVVFLKEQRETIVQNDRLMGPPALVIEMGSHLQATAVLEAPCPRVLDRRPEEALAGTLRDAGIHFSASGNAFR